MTDASGASLTNVWAVVVRQDLTSPLGNSAFVRTADRVFGHVAGGTSMVEVTRPGGTSIGSPPYDSPLAVVRNRTLAVGATSTGTIRVVGVTGFDLPASIFVGFPIAGFVTGLNSVVAGPGTQVVSGTATMSDTSLALLVAIAEVPEPPGSQIFADGFESGDLSAWSSKTP